MPTKEMKGSVAVRISYRRVGGRVLRNKSKSISCAIKGPDQI